MSTQSSWGNVEIHAYVDGVLDPDTSARLEADSRSDAALAARIAQQRELRTRLRAEFDRVLEEPVPQRLHEVLAGPGSGAVVTPIGVARKAGVPTARPVWSLREWGTLAATLAFGAVLGSFLFSSSSGLPIEIVEGRLVASGYLDTALSTQIAGTTEGVPARVDISFRAAGGEYCRTFALRTGARGLACRRDGRWSVELLDGAAAPASETGGFRQASSVLSPAMLGAMTALGAGDPLTAEEEQQRLGSGWDRPGP